MFTGIVATKGTLISVQRLDNLQKMVISAPANCLEQLSIGASVSVNGVCLTVTRHELKTNDVVGQIYVDVIAETLQKTNLGELQRGDKVNLERSVTFGTEIGGHLLSGHIHCCAELVTIEQADNRFDLHLKLDPKWLKFVLPKGFIAVNGASLTVGEVFTDGFMIHLIPETLNITNLGQLQPGDSVNVELDQQTMAIVSTVERVLAQNQPIDPYQGMGPAS